MRNTGGETDFWLSDDPARPAEGYVWWSGPCACSLCGYRCVVIMPIPEGLTDPPCPIECARCGNMTLDPGCDADPDDEDEGPQEWQGSC